VDVINLAQNRDIWLAVMNMVMNLLVIEMTGNFLTSSTTISS
jgi:hypothetical protein